MARPRGLLQSKYSSFYRQANYREYYGRGSNESWSDWKDQQNSELFGILFPFILLAGFALFLVPFSILVYLTATGQWVLAISLSLSPVMISYIFGGKHP